MENQTPSTEYAKSPEQKGQIWLSMFQEALAAHDRAALLGALIALKDFVESTSSVKCDPPRDNQLDSIVTGREPLYLSTGSHGYRIWISPSEGYIYMPKDEHYGYRCAALFRTFFGLSAHEDMRVPFPDKKDSNLER